MFDLLKGTYELAVGSTLIPAELLGDLSPNYQEGVLEAETQAGKISTPSGKADTSEFTFTLFLPRNNAQQYLGVLWPDAYNEPTAAAQASGNIVFSTDACGSRTPQKMNIHSICDSTDDNDFHIFAGVARILFNPTLSTSEVASFEVTVYMQPNENGDRFRFGTGNLAVPSIYDVTTQETVPIAVSA